VRLLARTLQDDTVRAHSDADVIKSGSEWTVVAGKSPHL